MLARIVGIVLGGILATSGYVVAGWGQLWGWAANLDLGPFEPHRPFAGGAAAILGGVLIVAALAPSRDGRTRTRKGKGPAARSEPQLAMAGLVLTESPPTVSPAELVSETVQPVLVADPMPVVERVATPPVEALPVLAPAEIEAPPEPAAEQVLETPQPEPAVSDPDPVEITDAPPAPETGPVLATAVLQQDPVEAPEAVTPVGIDASLLPATEPDLPAPPAETAQDAAVAEAGVTPVLLAEPAPGEPAEVEAAPETFEALRERMVARSREADWAETARLLIALKAAARSHSEKATAYRDLGDFARSQGQMDDAAEAYETAVSYARDAFRMAPEDDAVVELLAGSLSGIGDVAEVEGRLDAALSAFEEALALRRSRGGREAHDPTAQRALSVSLERLADLREDRGHRMRALDLYRESYDVAARLAAADPARFGPDLDQTRQRLAELEARVGV
jgi:hypothetical protein